MTKTFSNPGEDSPEKKIKAPLFAGELLFYGMAIPFLFLKLPS